MKKFNEFREDQFQSIVENLSEEDKQYLMEQLTGDNPGLGMALLSGAARTAKFGLYDVPKFAINRVAKPVVSKTWNLASKVLNSRPARAYYAGDAAWSTGKSIKNKEPWYQTASKGLQGYFAKKTGGVKRGLTGLVGQMALPGDKSSK
tara:strand:+ start:330 stop:773 length:444 start_codon:yes stop_codon:yes gene_type:complete